MEPLDFSIGHRRGSWSSLTPLTRSPESQELRPDQRPFPGRDVSVTRRHAGSGRASTVAPPEAVDLLLIKFGVPGARPALSIPGRAAENLPRVPAWRRRDGGPEGPDPGGETPRPRGEVTTTVAPKVIPRWHCRRGLGKGHLPRLSPPRPSAGTATTASRSWATGGSGYRASPVPCTGTRSPR